MPQRHNGHSQQEELEDHHDELTITRMETLSGRQIILIEEEGRHGIEQLDLGSQAWQHRLVAKQNRAINSVLTYMLWRMHPASPKKEL